MSMNHGYAPTLKFVFNIRKASQAAAYLVQLHDGRLNLMVLLTLLYLADRASLIETGYTITGDQMVCVPSGPALSRLYDLAKWGPPANPQEASDVWYAYVTEVDDVVSLAEKTPQTDELSAYERELLARIDRNHGNRNPFELRDLAQRLPEYAAAEGSSIPIDPVVILRHGGKSEAEIADIVATAGEILFLDSFSRTTA